LKRKLTGLILTLMRPKLSARRSPGPSAKTTATGPFIGSWSHAKIVISTVVVILRKKSLRLNVF
jgi:hypothetical protein